MSPEVWSDFSRLSDRVGLSKKQHSQSATETTYARWQCPYCPEVVEAVSNEGAKVQKSVACKWHFWNLSQPCKGRPVHDLRGQPKTKRHSMPIQPPPPPAPPPEPGAVSPSLRRRSGATQAQAQDSARHKRHRPSPAPSAANNVSTVYALVHAASGRVLYIGKTVDPDRRLGQHRAPSSGCRLVRQYVRKHGRKSIDLQPLLRCAAADADSNEDLYINHHDTMHPRGLNLRHAAGAGDETEHCTALMPVEPRAPPPEPPTALVLAHRKSIEAPGAETLATAAAWTDLALILNAPDDDEDDASDDVAQSTAETSVIYQQLTTNE